VKDKESGFSFVICSINPRLAIQTERWILANFGSNVADISFIKDSSSISKAYNEGLKKATGKYICFVHEDVEIGGINISALKRLLDAKNTGFVGVAGCRDLNEEAIWWQSDGLSGACGHIKIESLILKKWYNNYGPHGSVLVLDGVILFAKIETLKDNNIFWDEEIFSDFDFYDISITYLANSYGLKNYTFSNILIYHWGLGYPRNSWNVNREKFKEWRRSIKHKIL